MLSNPADAQNVSSLGLGGRNIWPKSSALYRLGTFKPHLLVSIQINKKNKIISI